MKKKLNRQTSILSILGKLVLLIGGVSLILLGVMLNNLSKVKEVAYTYMLNTAKLFMEDIETDIEMVTSEIFYRGINDTCFNRLPQDFYEETGQFLQNYIMSMSMEKAKEILLKTDIAVSEIAMKVGYTNLFGIVKENVLGNLYTPAFDAYKMRPKSHFEIEL